MKSKPRVVIVGAGLVGAAIAYRMAQAGAAVTVLDQNLPAGKASGASFGWINASFFASPDHFLLRQAGILAHRRLDAELGATGTQWPGAIWWEETGAAFDEQAVTLAALGYPVAELTAAEFATAEASLATVPDRSLAFRSEGATDAAALTIRLLQAATGYGANLWFGFGAVGFRVGSNRVDAVITDQGDIASDHVIIAAGTSTQSLLAPLGIDLPMLSRPGMILLTRPIKPMIKHILVTPQGELRQDADGRIITPAAASHQGDKAEKITELPGHAAARTLDWLQRLLPKADLQIERVLLAHRPVPQDGLPAIGPLGPGGLYVAVMHSGVTLAPLVGELLAAEILHDAQSPLLASFRPSRFST